MKKTYWFLIIIFLIIGSTGGYFYMSGNQSETTFSKDIKEGIVSTTRENSKKEEPSMQKEPTQEDNQSSETNQNKTTAEEPSSVAEDDTDKEVSAKDDTEAKELYSYRKEFKDPFTDYNMQEPREISEVISRTSNIANEDSSTRTDQTNRKQNKTSTVVELLTPERLRETVPFKLKGIIGSSDNHLVVIEQENDSNIFREGQTINGYKIINISEEQMQLSYKGIKFFLEVRSGLGGR